jgi:uncharacterized ion transporter superfamily protein YfcC
MDDRDERRQAAVERITKRREFASHLVSYLVVNTMLVVIWAISGAGYFWPVWPILGWGAGLVIHAWITYGQRPITEEDIRNETDRHAP